MFLFGFAPLWWLEIYMGVFDLFRLYIFIVRFYLTFDCCYARCEISEGRVTNCVLSTLSAVRIVVVVLFSCCCCCTIRIRVRTWRLCSRFLRFFRFTLRYYSPNLFVFCILFNFVFLVGATIAHWSEIERQQRSEAKRYDTKRFTRFTSETDTMWFFSTREISLCMRTVYKH